MNKKLFLAVYNQTITFRSCDGIAKNVISRFVRILVPSVLFILHLKQDFIILFFVTFSPFNDASNVSRHRWVCKWHKLFQLEITHLCCTVFHPLVKYCLCTENTRPLLFIPPKNDYRTLREDLSPLQMISYLTHTGKNPVTLNTFCSTAWCLNKRHAVMKGLESR